MYYVQIESPVQIYYQPIPVALHVYCALQYVLLAFFHVYVVPVRNVSIYICTFFILFH